MSRPVSDMKVFDAIVAGWSKLERLTDGRWYRFGDEGEFDGNTDWSEMDYSPEAANYTPVAACAMGAANYAALGYPYAATECFIFPVLNEATPREWLEEIPEHMRHGLLLKGGYVVTLNDHLQL